MADNGFFERMTREAMDELASGEKGWRDADSNTLILAAFGMLSSSLSRKLARPLWWFAGTVGAGVVAYIVSLVVSV